MVLWEEGGLGAGWQASRNRPEPNPCDYRHRLSSYPAPSPGVWKVHSSASEAAFFEKANSIPWNWDFPAPRLSLGAWQCCRQRGLWLSYKNIPGPGSSQSSPSQWGPVGATMGQEGRCNRQPPGHLSTAGLGSCLQPLLSGTATSSVCPLFLAHSSSTAGWMPTCAGHPEPANSSLWGKRPRVVESQQPKSQVVLMEGLASRVLFSLSWKGGSACDTVNSL